VSLSKYFENVRGTGVLATSDAEGNVDAAVYARPYVVDEDTVAFSMLERQSFANLQSNPRAAYLFVEAAEGYKGLRLYLLKTGEETDEAVIEQIKSQHHPSRMPSDARRRLVYFSVQKQRALVGDLEA